MSPAAAVATPSTAGALRVALAGASGRMGRMLVEAVAEAEDCVLSGALEVAGITADSRHVATCCPKAC